MRKISLVLVILSASIVSRSELRYHITDIGVLPGESTSNAYGINNYGHVVGGTPTSAFIWKPDGSAIQPITATFGTWPTLYSINDSDESVGEFAAAGQSKCFYWSPNTGPTRMHPFRDAQSARSINNAGQAGGTYAAPVDNSASKGYRWTMATGFENLGGYGGFTHFSQGRSINDSGVVVGLAVGMTGTYTAVRWTPGQTTYDLGRLPGGTNSGATDINNAGTILGYSSISSGATHAVMWSDARGMEDLTALYGLTFGGSAMNNSETVVGTNGSGSAGHAMIWTRSIGSLDINTICDESGSSWLLNSASDINASGQICGTGIINGQTHAFFATPVPEPGTLIVLVVPSLIFSRRRIASKNNFFP